MTTNPDLTLGVSDTGPVARFVVERKLADGGAFHTIRAFGAKMAEHAGRLAAVLAIYADPDAMEVSAEMMACGIALAHHYAAELLRLQGPEPSHRPFASRPGCLLGGREGLTRGAPSPRSTNTGRTRSETRQRRAG